jgi:M6 family metalloprotease-like protein
MKICSSRLIRIVVVCAVLLSSISQTFSASANISNACRIKASDRQTVSLGFPVRPERLANISKPRILVIPFQLTDHPNFIFSQQDIQDYAEASKNILALSSGKVSLDVVIAPTVKTEFSIRTMDTLKANQMIGYRNQDESISTYGFVRRFIANIDPSVDFKNFDAVILDGSIRQTASATDIAEAFMFHSDNRNTFNRPIQTNESVLSNAILLSNHNTIATITHEILHLFGLTDLYGTNTGPNELSLMASNEITLTTYEKWILGWLPDSEVQCFDNPSPSVIAEFKFNASKDDQLLVIPDSSGTHLMIQTSKVRGQKRLSFFSLNNEGRPPMEFFMPQKLANNGRIGLGVDDYTSIGEQINSPKYTVVVSDITQENIILKVVPNGLTGSTQFTDLIKQALAAKAAIEQKAKQEADAKAAAELKAKQEADAKAASELKAKQEADAKTAAELKAKQEADAKAAATKKSTITCVKGKLTKKVTAVKPKCPTGYKKK